MNRAIVVCGLFAAAFAMSPAAADTGDCSFNEIIDVGDLGLVYYVIVGDTPDAAWGYVETNGVAGVQRGGVALHGGVDPCQTEDPAGPDLNFY